MAAADISGQNRKKRDVGNDSPGEAVVAAAPSAKKAKRSGPESSRKQKTTTIPKIQLDESRERAEMASAERDCLQFENQLLNESQSAKGEALLGLSHSIHSHLLFACSVPLRKMHSCIETVRDRLSKLYPPYFQHFTGEWNPGSPRVGTELCSSYLSYINKHTEKYREELVAAKKRSSIFNLHSEEAKWEHDLRWVPKVCYAYETSNLQKWTSRSLRWPQMIY